MSSCNHTTRSFAVDFRTFIGVVFELYWGYIGIMENGNHYKGVVGKVWGLRFRV